MNLHPPDKSNTNSTQILDFILICFLLGLAISMHRVLCTECSVYYIPLQLFAQFSATVSSSMETKKIITADVFYMFVCSYISFRVYSLCVLTLISKLCTGCCINCLYLYKWRRYVHGVANPRIEDG